MDTTTTTTPAAEPSPAAAAARAGPGGAAAALATDGASSAAMSSVIEAFDSVTGNKILIRIQNISSTTDLGVKLDLKKIALKCRNTEFNPRRYGAVIMRLREPRALALIFPTGKICISGVKSRHDATFASKKITYILDKVGFKPQEESLECKVQNIVGTVDCGFPIRLEGLVYAHSAYTTYEPELYPGLIYKLDNPQNVVCLIFVSGKVVITGAKNEFDVSKAATAIYPVLHEFKKVHVSSLPGLPSTPGGTESSGFI